MPQNEKSPLSGAEEAFFELRFLRAGLADRPLSARIPPPIGRKRPAEATRLTRKRERQNVCDNNRGLQGVSITKPFLLDCQAVSAYN